MASIVFPSGTQAVAIVTGGGSGIGKALAMHLASKDHIVVIVGRRTAMLADVASAAPAKIYACTADVGTEEGRAVVASFIGDRPVSMLIHNAGTCQFAPLHDMPMEKYQQSMSVNVEAPIFLTQALMGNLKSGEARVLMVSSGAADAPIPTMGMYCATKAALKMVWMVLRDELKDVVQVGYCVPGLVQTEITDSMVADPAFALKDFIAARLQSGDFHTVEEVSEWMSVLLDPKIVDNDTFTQRLHDIDDPQHQHGVKITLTMEGTAGEAKYNANNAPA